MPLDSAFQQLLASGLPGKPTGALLYVGGRDGFAVVGLWWHLACKSQLVRTQELCRLLAVVSQHGSPVVGRSRGGEGRPGDRLHPLPLTPLASAEAPTAQTAQVKPVVGGGRSGMGSAVEASDGKAHGRGGRRSGSRRGQHEGQHIGAQSCGGLLRRRGASGCVGGAAQHALPAHAEAWRSTTIIRSEQAVSHNLDSSRRGESTVAVRPARGKQSSGHGPQNEFSPWRQARSRGPRALQVGQRVRGVFAPSRECGRPLGGGSRRQGGQVVPWWSARAGRGGCPGPSPNISLPVLHGPPWITWAASVTAAGPQPNLAVRLWPCRRAEIGEWLAWSGASAAVHGQTADEGVAGSARFVRVRCGGRLTARAGRPPGLAVSALPSGDDTPSTGGGDAGR